MRDGGYRTLLTHPVHSPSLSHRQSSLPAGKKWLGYHLVWPCQVVQIQQTSFHFGFPYQKWLESAHVAKRIRLTAHPGWAAMTLRTKLVVPLCQYCYGLCIQLGLPQGWIDVLGVPNHRWTILGYQAGLVCYLGMQHPYPPVRHHKQGR